MGRKNIVKRAGVTRACAALVVSCLGIILLGACDESPSTAVSSRLATAKGHDRKITGVLTVYMEGESFRECSLQEPWYCDGEGKPECGFDATPAGDRVINAAIDKAGAREGFATFGVVMIGSRADGFPSGHLSVFDCEYRARAVLEVHDVPALPPAD